MFGAVTKPIKTAALKRNHQGTRSEEFGARAVGASRRNLYRQWTAYIAGERIDVVRALLLVRHVGRYLMRYKIKASETCDPSGKELMARLVARDLRPEA